VERIPLSSRPSTRARHNIELVIPLTSRRIRPSGQDLDQLLLRLIKRHRGLRRTRARTQRTREQQRHRRNPTPHCSTAHTLTPLRLVAFSPAQKWNASPSSSCGYLTSIAPILSVEVTTSKPIRSHTAATRAAVHSRSPEPSP